MSDLTSIERQIAAFRYDPACTKMGVTFNGQINPAQLRHRLPR